MAIVCIIATIYSIICLIKDRKITDTETKSSGIIINGVDQKKETYTSNRRVNNYGIIGELTGKKDDLFILDVFAPMITGVFAVLFIWLCKVKYKTTIEQYDNHNSYKTSTIS